MDSGLSRAISRKPLMINAGKGAAFHSALHGDMGLHSGREVMTLLIAGGMLKAPQARSLISTTLSGQSADSAPCACRRGPCSAPHSAARRLNAAQRAADQHRTRCGEDAEGAPDAQNARQGAPAAHALRERRPAVAHAPLHPGQPPLQPAGPWPHLCQSSLQRRHRLHHRCATALCTLLHRGAMMLSLCCAHWRMRSAC